MGERLRRVDGCGRQNRKYLGREEAVEKGPLSRLKVGRRDEADAALAERRHDRLGVERGRLRAKRASLDRDPLQELRGGGSIGLAMLEARAHQFADSRDADHEEFVEVRREDAEKPCPLEHRVRFVPGLFQDPTVEAEPSEGTAQEARFAHATSTKTGLKPKTSSKRPPFWSSASRSSARSSAPSTSIRISSPTMLILGSRIR